MPTDESLTRQLFLGWQNVQLRAAIALPASTQSTASLSRRGVTPWTGHEVTGTLDDQPMRAVAVRRQSADSPSCWNEVIVFSKRKTEEAPESSSGELTQALEEYLTDKLEEDPRSQGGDDGVVMQGRQAEAFFLSAESAGSL